MVNLLTAIKSKFAGSQLNTDCGGRIYLDRAPDSARLPYVVYFIVSSVPQDNFKTDLDDVIIQFSLFSSSEDVTEITTLYSDLSTLFEGCALTITSTTLVWMYETNLTTMVDDITVIGGTKGVRHWAVDYSIMVEK